MHVTVALDEVGTLIAGLFALCVGGFLIDRVGLLRKMSLPVSVLGGVLASIAVLALRQTTGLELQFATGARDVLLLVFFTTIGLTAKLSSLKTGGKGLAILCGATVVLLVLQDAIGVGVALLRGAHPFYGLLVGGLSFVGGPGTAIAWSAHARTLGLPMASEIALGSATLATLAGALVAPPLTNWLIRRHGLRSETEPQDVPWAPKEEVPEPPTVENQRAILRTLLLVLISVALGSWLNAWARSHEVLLPGFLTAMLAGVLIVNLFDVLGIELPLRPMELGGAISLQLFLVLSLMGLHLWEIGRVIVPLLLNLGVQITFTAVLALVVLFRLLGRDYDAAVTSGGFIGFGLASMPVAFATMEEVTSVHGPSPRAFLLITLVGSFFVDLANAGIAKLFLLLPWFR